MAIAIDRIWGTKDRRGESQVWSVRRECLCRVASLAGLLHRLHPESDRREAFPMLAPFGLRHGGGAVRCCATTSAIMAITPQGPSAAGTPP